MKIERDVLERQMAEHREKARSLRAYIAEFTGMAERCGTDDYYCGEELWKAKNDAEYHEEEAERINELLREDSHATYYLHEDAAGEWRWRLLAANNRAIAESGEGYHNKRDCLYAIELVKGSKHAPIKEKR